MILCASLLMIVIFGSMARNYKKSPIPTGAGKLFEPLVIFIRDEIAIPNIGPKYHKYILFIDYFLLHFIPERIWFITFRD
jgi:F-type H+-transporting ATPase subunit a